MKKYIVVKLMKYRKYNGSVNFDIVNCDKVKRIILEIKICKNSGDNDISYNVLIKCCDM